MFIDIPDTEYGDFVANLVKRYGEPRTLEFDEEPNERRAETWLVFENATSKVEIKFSGFRRRIKLFNITKEELCPSV